MSDIDNLISFENNVRIINWSKDVFKHKFPTITFEKVREKHFNIHLRKYQGTLKIGENGLKMKVANFLDCTRIFNKIEPKLTTQKKTKNETGRIINKTNNTKKKDNLISQNLSYNIPYLLTKNYDIIDYLKSDLTDSINNDNESIKILVNDMSRINDKISENDNKIFIEIYLTPCVQIKKKYFKNKTLIKQEVGFKEDENSWGIISSFNPGNLPDFSSLDFSKSDLSFSNSYLYDEKTTLLEHFKFLPSEKIILPLDKFEKLLRFYRIFIVLLCNCSDEFKEISLSRLFDKSVWEEVLKKNDSENAEERKYFFTPIEYSKFSGNFEINELLINQILNLHDESIINFETSKSNVKEKEKNIFDYIKQSLEKEFEALLTFSTTQIDDVENVSNLDFLNTSEIEKSLKSTALLLRRKRERPDICWNSMNKLVSEIKANTKLEIINLEDNEFEDSLIKKFEDNYHKQNIPLELDFIKNLIIKRDEDKLIQELDRLIDKSSRNFRLLLNEVNLASPTDVIVAVTSFDILIYKQKFNYYREIINKFGANLYYNKFKLCLYELSDLIFDHEDSIDFFYKLACINGAYSDDKEFSQLIKIQSHSCFPLLKDKSHPISIKSLLLKEKTCSNIISEFRKYYSRTVKYHSKESMNIDYCDFLWAFARSNLISLGQLEKSNFSYNKDFAMKPNKVKTPTCDISIQDLFCLKKFPLSKSQIQSAKKLNTIGCYFEKYIKLNEVIEKIDIFDQNTLINLSSSGKTLILHSLSTPSSLEDSNFETLETLGDSYLKFFCSIGLYLKLVIYDQSNKTKEGVLVLSRTKLTNNDNLYSLGVKFDIDKKAFTLPISEILSNWKFPLRIKDNSSQLENITKKNVIDLVESCIGAFGLISLNDCFSLIIKFGIYDFLYEENELSKSNKLNENINKDINNNQIVKRIRKNLSQIKTNQLVDIKEKVKIDKMLPERINFTNLMLLENKYNNHILKLDINTYKKELNFEKLDVLEKIINYNFKNKLLLKQAFTPKLSNVNRNLEQLEFLGDAIVEFFIMDTVFRLMYFTNEEITIPSLNSINNSNENSFSLNEFSKLNIEKYNKKINPSFLTSIKSLLATNEFMGQIMTFFGIEKCIYIVGNKNVLQNINTYSESFVHDNYYLNDYNTNQIPNPKIISDCFEALLAAVYIDSWSLEKTYEVFNLFYFNFICYTTKYVNIKFSPVNELVDKFNEKKIKTLFYVKKIDDIYLVECKIELSNETNNKDTLEFIANKKINLNQIISKGVSTSQDKAKELSALEALRLYFNK